MTNPPQQPSQINITFGTAGHIDHGKTALIKLLTGCETDRLKEEKERGMSIELGFAPCKLGDLEVGIVDVPGHENFIKTMVAGAAGIDGVIFVVAADDGIMPQTREHLDILTLLGVRYGLVALTKTDIVSQDRTETVIEHLKNFLRGTFLDGAAICPMSSITAAGFEDFYDSLKDLIRTIQPRSTEGLFRMPVEKAFSVKGFGTVISGIPAGGSASLGDELVLLPAGLKSRIKAIQVYGKDARVVKTGQCAALNLPQIDYKIVHRGCVLAEDGFFEPGCSFLCKLRLLEQVLKVKNASKVKFHTGTSETTATLYLMESNSAAGGAEALVQIRTEHPIVAAPADKFIIRHLTPVRTIGGGMIIERLPHKLTRNKKGLLEDLHHRALAVQNTDTFVEYCLEKTPLFAAGAKEIALRSKVPVKKVVEIISQLTQQQKAVKLGADLYAHSETLKNVCLMITTELQRFHEERKDSPGMEKEYLVQKSGLAKNVFAGTVEYMLKNGSLVLRKDRFALRCHEEHFDSDQQKIMSSLESLFKKYLFNPPSAAEAAEQLKTDLANITKAIILLTEQKILVQIQRDVYFHADAITQAKQKLIEYMHAEGDGRLESVKFKYLLDTTRKYALPMLDYMDKIGVTTRVGNTRYLKK